VEAMALYAGEGVGLVHAVQPAAAIVEEFANAIATARDDDQPSEGVRTDDIK
jgi:hypothetical protein